MDPVTVMTCIQVASSVAGMLSPKGPGVADLLNIQTQMLKNISNQVAELQKGINIIINDIQNLKTFVEYTLPSEIHKKFVTDEQIAKFSGYNRVVNTYLEDRQDMGILRAYDRNKEDIYEKLKEIQSKRDELFLYKDYFLAPLVARCFKAEIDLMIILYGDLVTKGKFKQVLLEYEVWLEDLQNKDNIYSVDYYINKFKEDLDKVNPNIYGFRMCKASSAKSEDFDSSSIGNLTYNYYYDLYYFDLNVEYLSFKRDFNPDIQNQMQIQSFDYQELVNIYNALHVDLGYIPTVVSPTVNEKFKDETLKITFRDLTRSEVVRGTIPLFHSRGEIENAASFMAFDSKSKSINHRDTFRDERFDVDRNFIESLAGCDNPNRQILTNKKYYDFASTVKRTGEQMVITITHKKIMLEIQNKIDKLRTFI